MYSPDFGSAQCHLLTFSEIEQVLKCVLCRLEFSFPITKNEEKSNYWKMAPVVLQNQNTVFEILNTLSNIRKLTGIQKKNK